MKTPRPPVSVQALRLLAAVGCRAGPGVFESLPSDPILTREVAGLASRFGLASALSAFVTSLPADRQTGDLAGIVVAGLRAEAHTRSQLELLSRVAERAEVRATSPIAVKGVGLVLARLTTPQERSFADADILIPADSLSIWERAAREAGATFKPGSTRHERGYIQGPDALIELHVSLSGGPGGEPGPAHAEVAARSRPACGAFGSLGLLTPEPAVCREIAVHHFLHAHGGDPLHALRTLQDLRCLEGEGDGPGLDWNRAGLRSEVLWLRGIARDAAAGGVTRAARQFLESLSCVADLGDRPLHSFSGEVDRWLAAAPAEKGGKLGLVFRQLFPPRELLGAPQGEAAPRTALRYLSRHWSFASRFLVTAVTDLADPDRKRRVRAWSSYLADPGSRTIIDEPASGVIP